MIRITPTYSLPIFPALMLALFLAGFIFNLGKELRPDPDGMGEKSPLGGVIFLAFFRTWLTASLIFAPLFWIVQGAGRLCARLFGRPAR